MHIPNSMLSGAICPVTAAVSTVGLVSALTLAIKSEKKPAVGRFAAVTALIFAAQMLNFPIMNGTSGHLLGGVMAAAMLGVPFGMLSVALVVSLQALFFADGGLSVLGANILNMAVIGAGCGGALYEFLASKFKGKTAGFGALAVASWLSVVIAALAVSIELSIDGVISFSQSAPAMLGVHALIGIGEALITIVAVQVFGTSRETKRSWKSTVIAPTVTAVVCALAVSPFACGWPDGLEFVGGKLNFLRDSAPSFVSPLPDYTVPAMGETMLSTGLAGIIGVCLCFAAAVFLRGIIALKPTDK
jgi:cobalt/nickel transport system permease protein